MNILFVINLYEKVNLNIYIFVPTNEYEALILFYFKKIDSLKELESFYKRRRGLGQ